MPSSLHLEQHNRRFKTLRVCVSGIASRSAAHPGLHLGSVLYADTFVDVRVCLACARGSAACMAVMAPPHGAVCRRHATMHVPCRPVTWLACLLSPPLAPRAAPPPPHHHHHPHIHRCRPLASAPRCS
jgi:hypothetical protein